MTDKKITEDFRSGAKAMFDMFLYKAANNYHPDPKVQKMCDIENNLLDEVAQISLKEVDEYAYDEWRSITDLVNENNDLKKQISSLKERLSKYKA
jgi:hypothetical protein